MIAKRKNETKNQGLVFLAGSEKKSLIFMIDKIV